ncbi:MAG: (Fe-S)-binding protein, partial [Gemmatimonadota bacterium]
MSKKVRVKDIARKELPVLDPLTPDELIPLPPPYDDPEALPGFKEIPDKTKERLVCNLDGVIAAGLPHPESEEEE